MAFRTLIPPTLRDLQALRTLGAWQLMLQALVTGGITGAVIGLFRRAFDLINLLIVTYVHGHSLADPLVGASIFAALIVLAALALLFLRFEPLVASSGIPQVELIVAGHLPMRWGTVIWAKFLGHARFPDRRPLCGARGALHSNGRGPLGAAWVTSGTTTRPRPCRAI